MAIHRLTELTIGQIAAGEVVERPVAAVKELLENALDAGSRRIDVLIEGGGIDLIEVRDDGVGIAYDDLALAVERHATSKLSSIHDLNELQTLGFRGEALASLAAVGDLHIRSRAHGAAQAGELRAEHGLIRAPAAIAWGDGTVVSVRDLFANVPARRKFLRKPATEAGYIARVVGAYALAYPAVAFTLAVDGAKQFATDGRGSATAAAIAVWGAATAEQLVQLETPADAPPGYGVHGIVSLPSIDRATRSQQHLFVQGRLIQNRSLTTAFEQAYHTLLMANRRPLGCILLEAPADEIDVNVHPTKSEVRFADERLMFALLQRGARDTLLAHTGRQSIPTVLTAPVVRGADDWTVQRRLALAHPERTFPSGPTARPAWSTPEPSGRLPQAGGRALPVLRVLGQVAGLFVVAEGPDGLYLIDQHAAHERVLFEQVMRDYEGRTADVQRLLTPVSVTLSPEQQSMLDACEPDLQRVGFELEPFGEQAVAIRGVPALLKVKDPAGALRTILDELIEGGRGQTRLESLAISAACHGSIRAGQPLSLLEMRELVNQLEACSSPLACGHGRPTMLRMSADDLSRQFMRR